MERLRTRVGDLKVTRLVRQFLKAGVLEEGFLLPTSKGTPQGGVISPLLANVALCAIEEESVGNFVFVSHTKGPEKAGGRYGSEQGRWDRG
jgi:RNA-directed DNA polymerase